MIMKRFVVRHGFTGVNRDQRDAFGAQGPPLDELGRKQAVELNKALIQLGIDPNTEPVAISELLRTKQTAELAGFTNMQVRPVLNEVQTGLEPETLKEMLQKRDCPEAVLERARQLLANPPDERVWVAHGLLIIGLHEVLGISRDPYIPEFCEIIQLDI